MFTAGKAGLAGGSRGSTRSLERIRREGLERAVPFPLENMSVFCASDRGLMDFFFNILFPSSEKSELLKQKYQFENVFIFVDGHRNFYCCDNLTNSC